MKKKEGAGTVYLLHFDRPYGPGGGANGRGTAGHYLWAKNLEQRLAQHEAGTGARLMQVVKDAGIGWRLARTWKEGGLARESQLKKQGGRSRMCPECRAAKAEARRQARRGTRGGNRGRAAPASRSTAPLRRYPALGGASTAPSAAGSAPARRPHGHAVGADPVRCRANGRPDPGGA
jgi:hypothetical protein